MADLLADNLKQERTGGDAESRSDLRDQLLAQKNELIGEITQAIANDFNNIMMSITGYAELELKRLPTEKQPGLKQVLSNAARASVLVQKLLTISRKRLPSTQPLDLNHVLTGTGDLLKQLIGDKASLTFQLDPSNPRISADPIGIEEAVIRLVINARDAVGKGGDIVVTTNSVDLADDIVGDTGLPGEYVLLSITDTGVHSHNPGTVQSDGVVDTNSRVNLSLAAVRGVVKASGGFVRYSSEPGKSTCFKLYFPGLQAIDAEHPEHTSPRNLPLARTVLIVDDDEAVRIPAAEFLKIEGFKVLQARTGAEAIHVVGQSRSSLDVLITDIVMPKMNGHEVAEKLLELHPGLKVLYMSGDVDRVRMPESSGVSQSVTLRKPFRLDVLKDHIHELLGE